MSDKQKATDARADKYAREIQVSKTWTADYRDVSQRLQSAAFADESWPKPWPEKM